MKDDTMYGAAYNDNQAAVNWAASVTTNGVNHPVKHIPGVINLSVIFTKEIYGGAHF